VEPHTPNNDAFLSAASANAQAVATPPPPPPDRAGDSRLSRIARGESVPSVVHGSVASEDHVLHIDHFNLWYGPKQALFDIDMGVPRGQVTALIGPSGCGKSTLIRCVNRMNDLLDIAQAHGHGLPEAQPVPDVDLRERRLSAARGRRPRPARAGRGV
jgi:phosphate transport system ATP-binding protein